MRPRFSWALVFLGSRSAVIRPANRRKEITVILPWMQAFLVYPLVFNDLLACSYYYMKYPLLIMRSAQQYAGSTWLSYVRAFRRQAAACHQTNSSYMNSELYYFRVLGCRRRRELTFRVHRWQRFLSLVPSGDSGRRGLGSAWSKYCPAAVGLETSGGG